MIPAPAITAWGLTRPWPTRTSIEQDLILARLIVEIYHHPALRDELVFRGGTCLHQIHLPSPLRYSEDLDFVRRTHSGVGDIFTALREIAATVGLDVRGTTVGEHPKIRLRAISETDALPLNVKIEFNTHETSPARDLERRPFTVDNSWFTGTADVLTFRTPELVATKLRALYQRKKGRDLFDLWLALTQLDIPATEIVACFAPYRPDGYTTTRAIDNLREKQHDPTFRHDLDLLVSCWPPAYTIDEATDLVIDSVLTLV